MSLSGESNSYDSIIIGAGISGLTATYRLSKENKTCLLIDPADAGGLVKTRRIEGFTLELGANTFVDNDSFTHLLEELKLSDYKTKPKIEKFNQYVWHNGAPCAVPKSPPQLLSPSPLIPFSKKAAIAFKLSKKNLLPEDTKDMSIRDFFGTLIDTSVADKILNPALRGIYGGDIAKLSSRTVFPALFEHVRTGGSLLSLIKKSKGKKKKSIFMLNSGNDKLVERLLEEIEAKVAILKQKATGFAWDNTSGSFVVSATDGHKYESREVYVATSGRGTAVFFDELDENFAEQLRAIQYAPVIVVHAAVPADQRLPDKGFGVLFPSSEKTELMGVMFNSELFPHMAPAGNKLITACLGGVDNTEVLKYSEDKIQRIIRNEVNKFLGIKIEKFLSTTFWPQAIPQYNVGHYKLVEYMEKLETDYPGLHFIGVDRGGVGVGDRVKMAMGN